MRTCVHAYMGPAGTAVACAPSTIKNLKPWHVFSIAWSSYSPVRCTIHAISDVMFEADDAEGGAMPEAATYLASYLEIAIALALAIAVSISHIGTDTFLP